MTKMKKEVCFALQQSKPGIWWRGVEKITAKDAVLIITANQDVNHNTKQRNNQRFYKFPIHSKRQGLEVISKSMSCKKYRFYRIVNVSFFCCLLHISMHRRFWITFNWTGSKIENIYVLVSIIASLALKVMLRLADESPRPIFIGSCTLY